MNVRIVSGCIAAVISLWHAWSLVGQAAAPASEIVPRKREVSIPIVLASSRAKRAASLECVVTTGPEIPLSALAFSSDGKVLAAGGYKEVLIWDLANASLSKRIGAGQISSFVRALTFGNDERLLAVGEGNPCGCGVVRIFDIETGEQTLSFQEPKDVIYALDVSADGKLLTAGGADSHVYIWNLEDKKLVWDICEHSDWIFGVSFSPDGKFLATGGADRTSQVWEVGTWKSVVKMQQSGTVKDLAFSPDGALLAVAVGGPNDRVVRIQNRDNPRQTSQMATGAGMPLDVVWTAKPNRLYVSCSDNTVKIFDMAKRRLAATLSGHKDWVYAIALSPDGTRIASACADGTVKLWDAANNRLLATLLQLSPGSDDWLIITAQGYLATSTGGVLQWKTTPALGSRKAGSLAGASLTTQPSELTDRFLDPESVRAVLAGKNVAPPAIQ